MEVAEVLAEMAEGSEAPTRIRAVAAVSIINCLMFGRIMAGIGA